MITLKHVSYSYPGTEVPALKDVCLDINPGEQLCILGANGSGKSTLAKLLCGIIIPDEGSVTVHGLDTKQEENLLPVRQKVGMVFQNPDNQLVATIVEEDVAFALENLGVPRAEMRERITAAMQATDTLKFAKSEPHKLSGGQKQRVAIAGVLAMQPQYLVLDEATAMLDPKGRASVLKTAHTLGREKGMAVIQITHYMEEALLSDRVAVMSGGEIVLIGTPSQVFSDSETLLRYKLRPPPIKHLFDLLNDKGHSLPQALSVQDACEVLSGRGGALC